MRRALLFLTCALVACTAAKEQMKEPAVPPSRPVQAADLNGSQWLAVDIGGGGVADESHSTLHFAAPNQVDGNTGCLFRGPLVTEVRASASTARHHAPASHRMWIR
jgi:hypothetical protein